MMQCNIDRRGRWVRGGWGVVLLALAVFVAGAAVVEGWRWWVWLLVAVVAAGGVFALFEAWKGWCGVRALGFRTWV